MRNRRLVNVLFFAIGFAVFAWAAIDAAERLGTRVFTSGSSQKDGASAAEDLRGPEREYSIDRIAASHLFGAPAPEHRPDPENAPETRLQMSLIGLISSEDPRMARALIRVNSSPVKGYRVGEQIAGTDATLHRVENLRVLLERGGAFESLALPRSDLFGSPERGAEG
jgi:type II secretory pathway component PulC